MRNLYFGCEYSIGAIDHSGGMNSVLLMPLMKEVFSSHRTFDTTFPFAFIIVADGLVVITLSSFLMWVKPMGVCWLHCSPICCCPRDRKTPAKIYGSLENHHSSFKGSSFNLSGITSVANISLQEDVPLRAVLQATQEVERRKAGKSPRLQHRGCDNSFSKRKLWKKLTWVQTKCMRKAEQWWWYCSPIDSKRGGITCECI